MSSYEGSFMNLLDNVIGSLKSAFVFMIFLAIYPTACMAALVYYTFLDYSTPDIIELSEANTKLWHDQNWQINFINSEPIYDGCKDKRGSVYFRSNSWAKASQWLVDHKYNKRMVRTQFTYGLHRKAYWSIFWGRYIVKWPDEERYKMMPCKGIAGSDSESIITIELITGDAKRHFITFENFNGKSGFDMSNLRETKVPLEGGLPPKGADYDLKVMDMPKSNHRFRNDELLSD